MRMLKILTILAVALLAQGCFVLSIHPLYSGEKLVSNDNLPGAWTGSDDEKGFWTFEETEKNGYRMTVVEEGKPDGLFTAHLIQLDGRYFIDLYPEEQEGANEYFLSHAISAHSFWLADIGQDTLRLASLDYDWLRDAIKAGKVDIDHEQLEHFLVLTGDTRELQALVVKYIDEAFEDFQVVHRVK